ncbi:uncharacterized protein [Diabrotica undecimpunctata]|uniref:uncharacterized protein n=1 Tax=Diabrotica undecimpunctata TaxID=50387 RepID=UPI003B6375FF
MKTSLIVLLLAVSQSYSQEPYNYQRPSNPLDHSSSQSNSFSVLNNGPDLRSSHTSVSVVPASNVLVNSGLNQGYNYPSPNGGFDSNLGSSSSNSLNINSGGNSGYNYQPPNSGFLLPSASRNVNFNSGYNDGPSGSIQSGSILPGSSSNVNVNLGLNGGYNYPITNSESHFSGSSNVNFGLTNNGGNLLSSSSQNPGSFLTNIPSYTYGSPSLSGSLIPSASSNLGFSNNGFNGGSLNSRSLFNNVPSFNYGSPSLSGSSRHSNNLFSGDSRTSQSFNNNNGLISDDSNFPPSFGPVPEQKHVYVYVAPPDPEEATKQLYIPAAPVNHKIIFIKAPSQSSSRTHVVQSGAKQEKTLVYVLVKKPEDPVIDLKTPAPTPASKPEVFFIKYKTNKDSVNVNEIGVPSNGLPSVENNRYGSTNQGFDPSGSSSTSTINNVSPVYGPAH